MNIFQMTEFELYLIVMIATRIRLSGKHLKDTDEKVCEWNCTSTLFHVHSSCVIRVDNDGENCNKLKSCKTFKASFWLQKLSLTYMRYVNYGKYFIRFSVNTHNIKLEPGGPSHTKTTPELKPAKSLKMSIILFTNL